MLPLLNPAIRDNTEVLSAQFAGAAPFRNLILDDFLDPAFCGELMTGFPSFDARQATNEHGEIGRKAVFSGVARLGPAYARFDQLMRDGAFLDWMSRVTGIPELLYDPDYVGGGTHENLAGQELDSHVDFNFHPTRHWHRRLNLIVFLNPEWDPGWGGCLELLRDPWATEPETRKTVVPLANRAVVFETTESSWHGFPRIQLPPGKDISRRSLAVYFYTRQRPAAQTATSHGTVYYQRPLPEHIRAGYTLKGEDVSEIQSLLARRDKHMQFLYERELEISGVMHGTIESPSFRIGRALTWPARRLRALLGKS